MYKNKRLKVLFLTLISSLLFLFPVNTTALEVGDVILTDWDEVATGTTSGTAGSVTYEEISGDTEITNEGFIAGNTNVYTVGASNNVDSVGWINLTDEYDYINKITIVTNLRAELAGTGLKNGDLCLEIYKDNISVINITLDYNNIDFEDTSGWQTLDSSTNSNFKQVNFTFTHVTTNQIIYNLSGDINAEVIGTSKYAGNWTTFDSIKLSAYGMTSTQFEWRIDDIIINTNENTDDSLPELTGTVITMNGIVGIHNTIIEKGNGFSVLTLGDTGRHGVIEIKDPDGITVYYSDVGYLKVFTRTFHKEGEYSFRIYDYNYPDGYDATRTFNVIEPVDWEEEYGSGHWAQFQQTGEDCEYKVNDYFDIVYYLPHNDTYNDESNYYKLLYFAMGTSADGTHYEDENAGGYRGYTLVPKNEGIVYLQDVCKITNFGQWRIEIWDCDEDNLARDEINHSQPIYVCRPVEPDDPEDSYYNTYTISLNPNYASYNRNGSVDVTITKSWDDTGRYLVNSPPSGYVAFESFDEDTVTFTINFSDYDDTHLGTWTISAYDDGGSPQDFNAITKTFKVVSTDNEVVEPSIFPSLPDTLGAIVGLIVTVFLTLSPLIVAGAMNNQMGSNIQIPPLLYGIMGALGVIVSTIFGWFPSWTLFFLIGVGIIIIVILYLIGQKQSGG